MPLLSDTSRQLAAALTIAALVIAGLVLGREVLIPLAAATLLSFILQPIVSRLTALRLPRGAAVALVLLLLIGAVIGVTIGFSAQMLSLTASLPEYKQNIIQKVRAVTGVGRDEGTIKRASEAIESLGKAVEAEMSGGKNASDKAPNSAGQIGVGQPVAPAANDAGVAPDARGPTTAQKEPPKEVVVVKDDHDGWKYVLTAAHPLASVALTLLLVMFLLLQHSDLRDRVVRIVGTDNLSGTTAAMSDAGERLSKLFLAQAFLNVSFGAIVAIALWRLGIPNALLWGGMTALLRFVPFIGSFLAAIPPVLLAAAVAPGWETFAMTVALFVIGEPIMGHIIEPYVLGDRAGISPFAMVASASFWTLLWGPIGLILAAPLTMVLVVLGRYVPGLEVFTVLLGDEPALTPAQEFYHRLLSGDGVAAGEQLDAAVVDGSIVSITDQIVLPGLQLAVADHRLSRLDREQIDDLRDTMRDVTALLPELVAASRKDAAGEETKTDAAGDRGVEVLVIPARGTIDVSAAEFVSQVIGASVAGTSTAVAHASGLTALSEARARLSEHPADVIVICAVSSLESQQLQFVIARARAIFPRTRILALDHGPRGDAQPSRAATAGSSAAAGRTSQVYQRMSDLVAAIKAAPRQAEAATSTPAPADAPPRDTPLLAAV